MPVAAAVFPVQAAEPAQDSQLRRQPRRDGPEVPPPEILAFMFRDDRGRKVQTIRGRRHPPEGDVRSGSWCFSVIF
jgi:hypothetical protein